MSLYYSMAVNRGWSSRTWKTKSMPLLPQCYRVMLNIKRIDHVLNTTVYSMTNTVPLIHLVRHRQLRFLGHTLWMSKEEPARRYALYIPTIGKRRPGQPHTSYLTYVQRLLGDNEGAIQEQQIATLADDRHAWRNLVDDDDVCIIFPQKKFIIWRQHTKHANFWFGVQFPLSWHWHFNYNCHHH